MTYSDWLTRIPLKVLFLSTVLNFFSISAQAQNIQNNLNNIELVEAAQLVIDNQTKKSEITSLVPAKDKPSKFYFPSKDGRIFVLSKSGQSNLFLDMSTLFPDQFIYGNGLGLYGLSFHPNFTKTGQLGFRKFYTAHAEQANTDEAIADDSILGDSLAAHHFDVIYEWSVDPYNQVLTGSAREVLRIARYSAQQIIVSMGYDPNLKPWNSDFGNLYIGLGGAKEESTPADPSNARTADLSGTVLRINPLQEGMNSYKPADNNPYSSGGKYPPEVWAFGFEKLQGFSWDSSGKRSMYVVDLAEGVMKLYEGAPGINYGADQQTPESPLYGTETTDNLNRRSPRTPLAIYNLKTGDNSSVGAVYRGKLVRSLVGSYIFADLNSETLLSVPSFYLTPQEHTKVLPVEVSNFYEVAEKNSGNGILMSTDKKGDLYLFSTKNQRLYTLAPTHNALIDNRDINEEKESEEDNTSYFWTYFFLICALLILAAVIVLKLRKIRNLEKLNNKYVKIRLCAEKNTLALFKKGEKESDYEISLSDITACQLLLNGETVLILNDQPGNGLNQQKEKQLRKILNSETIGKMGSDRTLHLEFAIITRENNEATHVSVYYRKGNRRLTRHSYQNSAEESLNLCWLFSQQINPQATGERTVAEPVNRDQQPGPDQPESKQAMGEQRNPAKSSEEAIEQSFSTIQNTGPLKTPSNAANKSEAASATKLPENNNSRSSTAITSPKESASIVSELEKLVELKQQELLTEQEFTQAKKRLLGN
ncbi:PQQ-dependent sugar dehydrogenase [Motiliproteus sp. MSK22-1]|uniref:PQQ-dependent sugar dehydrogenase n=1 Tax=Motiliproteus sp. MSK22-1 TaxID=1897630 RepID=UPI0009763A34|nr:PQQ-dependent sugar dehydrogenase [Motiliproteus sp. MSK22-1]OMH39131.1 hypothetical protein BGP75_05375 [Motiliproteus sp. MSK22-1]